MPTRSPDLSRLGPRSGIVAGARYGDIGGRELDLSLYKAEIQIVAVTAGPGGCRPSRIQQVWQGPPPRGIELRGLLFVRAGEDFRRAAPL